VQATSDTLLDKGHKHPVLIEAPANAMFLSRSFDQTPVFRPLTLISHFRDPLLAKEFSLAINLVFAQTDPPAKTYSGLAGRLGTTLPWPQ
jgi:hypothetical protein